MSGMHGSSRVRVLLELAAGVSLLGAATWFVVFHDSGQRGLAEPASASQVAAFQNDADGAAQTASALRDNPYRLIIPTLDVDAPIVSVTADDEGILGIPRDPGIVGWWSDGSPPGSDSGTTVLAGHANTAELGRGALYDLEELEAGDELEVSGWDRQTQEFRVDAIARYSKSELPAAEAFDQDGEGRLAIVSCDDLDETTGQYRDNIIVYATLEAP